MFLKKSGSYNVEKAAKKENQQETKKKMEFQKKELTKHLNKKESPKYTPKGNDDVKNVTSKKWVNNKTFNKKE